MFIAYVNKLISKFGHLQPKVLLNSVHMKYKLYIRDLKFLTSFFFQCDNVLVRSCFSHK